MIVASFKVYAGRNVEIMDDVANGDSINAALISVKKKIRKFRAAAKKEGQLDPLRNWNSIELFLNKTRGKSVKKEEPLAE